MADFMKKEGITLRPMSERLRVSSVGSRLVRTSWPYDGTPCTQFNDVG